MSLPDLRHLDRDAQADAGAFCPKLVTVEAVINGYAAGRIELPPRSVRFGGLAQRLLSLRVGGRPWSACGVAASTGRTDSPERGVMKQQKRALWFLAGVLTIAAGCTPKMPPYSPERLQGVSRVTLLVGVEVVNADNPFDAQPQWSEWSAEAREQVRRAVATAFSSEGLVVTVSDVRPPVPWNAGKYGLINPGLDLSGAGCWPLGADAVAVDACLEVVGKMTVKGTLSRAFESAASLYPPALAVGVLSLPVAPTMWVGYYYGAGETVIRFRLTRRGEPESAPAWAYEEWFFGGLDLRDPAKVQEVVGRALEHYRKALAEQG